jgi:hypothetical protein
MKKNRLLARRVAVGSADAGDITVTYRTLSYLFDTFLVSCIVILYYAVDKLRWILRMNLEPIPMRLGPIRVKLGLLRKRSFR